MKLKGIFRILSVPKSRAEVFRDSLPGDTIEVSIDTKNAVGNKVPKMTVKNVETKQETTKYFNELAKILNGINLEEVD